ncbi:glycoside hydrolase family 3 N-terminal domain-containing protein [Arthrobacter antibioticus]|uniref:glycoside hydrolase family 3 N-terminal domain-containing protein n=1 Tax=Arthrobacter sp. H35-MC1 TaxID=3046203 RepID=UPI0024BA683B|nr:glycoside hydrolase family 3 N-terminal domain-containing protein [Arthrobacter sp. H35-MC1]MDJ0316445.1 glycoside hydrolase family 3 N-terminal domain-containing protein [Arthrobacter sp. H35-MC1]
MFAAGGRRGWIIGTALVAAALVATFILLAVNSQGSGRNNAASSTSSQSPMASRSPKPSLPTPITAPSSTPAYTSPASPSSERPTQAPASSSPARVLASKKLAAMSLEQKVGQLLMVSTPVTGADANSLYAVDTLYVGNVFMKGRSEAGQAGIGAQVAAISGHVSGSRTQGVRAFVATDQEGGFVQIMRGAGFAQIPQAIEQGQLPAKTLLADATLWGQQLASVGVNVNLAPVMDTVPSAAFAPQNAPIGAFGREYGFTPGAVSSSGVAFAKGMLAAGIDPTIKHFPGLGRVILNTDVSAGVVDNITTRNDAFIGPFQDAVNAGVPWLMISNASYPLIDPDAMAPFSSVIVHDMVRGDLGFKGIIVSDDICDAVQVSAVPVRARGVGFIRAGGTMALCTNQTLLPPMYAGMMETARADPGFAKQIDAATLLVLQAKAAKGLID